jgi:hypothetical protein
VRERLVRYRRYEQGSLTGKPAAPSIFVLTVKSWNTGMASRLAVVVPRADATLHHHECPWRREAWLDANNYVCCVWYERVPDESGEGTGFLLTDADGKPFGPGHTRQLVKALRRQGFIEGPKIKVARKKDLRK